MISTGRCSEMDIVMDLWLTAVYNNPQVQGSEIGPVTYLRNGTGNPLVTYSELGNRWGVSKATVGRVLKKLSDAGYISLMTFPGRYGSVIYLQNYLSTMFQISDVMIDKEEVAMVLNIKLELSEDGQAENPESAVEHHAQCIERSHQMLKLLDTAIDLLRNKHKNGESYYWLLYYSFLSPQQLRNVEEIIEKLRPYIRAISFRTYYRRRREAIESLSSILWGYTAKDSMDVLEQFFPDRKTLNL